MKREFQKYSYKVDKQTGDILPVVVDANNHLIDALRYAVEGLHRKGLTIDTGKSAKTYKDPYGLESDDEGENWKTL